MQLIDILLIIALIIIIIRPKHKNISCNDTKNIDDEN